MKIYTPLLFIIFLAACSHLKKPSEQVKMPSVFVAIDTSSISRSTLKMKKSVMEIYISRNSKPLWFDTEKLSAAGDSLWKFIQQVDRYGLIVSDYHAEKLKSLLSDSSSTSIAEADVLLTDASLLINSHLQFGRVDAIALLKNDFSNHIDSLGIALLKTQPSFKTVKSMFEQVEPSHMQYRILKDSLQQMLSFTSGDSATFMKIRKITLTMERLRATKLYPPRCIRVNIPSFILHVYENDSIAFTSNVIVGRPDTRTPQLESVIKSFIIYPYWHVPRGIATKEILPSIKKDSTYLYKKNYDVLNAKGEVVNPDSIDWQSLHENNFPYVLRQREGMDNTLGIIKFSFNNPYGVYLHDTNGRRLFKREKRALSHGCVRVHKAIDLAKYLLKDDNVYITSEDLDQYLSLKQRYQVGIRKPIDLFIEYFTCEAKEDRLFFYDDVYGKDEALYQLLHSEALQASAI